MKEPAENFVKRLVSKNKSREKESERESKKRTGGKEGGRDTKTTDWEKKNQNEGEER
jgi:hypothetical protein